MISKHNTMILAAAMCVAADQAITLAAGKPSSKFKDGILDCRSGAGGPYAFAPTLAIGLDQNVEHTLRLEPFDDRAGAAEWRIESVCVAGAGTRVWR